MFCYCKDEFDWLMNIINKDNCFSSFKDISDFIDSGLLELRYMRKRFGYLFYNSIKYIVKHNRKYAVFVNKEDKLVASKPLEERDHYQQLAKWCYINLINKNT